jgi:hypothetical protein
MWLFRLFGHRTFKVVLFNDAIAFLNVSLTIEDLFEKSNRYFESDNIITLNYLKGAAIQECGYDMWLFPLSDHSTFKVTQLNDVITC